MTTSAKNAEAFLNRLQEDPLLQKQFADEDVTVITVLDWAREHGYEFSKTDLVEAITARGASATEPLPEEELETISGGAIQLRENIEFPFVKKVLFPERYAN